MKHGKFKLSADEIRAFEEREREPREALELGRLQAVRMYGRGLEMSVIRQVSGASRRTVAEWVKAYQATGLEGLKPGWKGGNHRTLTVEQRAACIQRLRQMNPAQILTKQNGVVVNGLWSIETVGQAVEQWSDVKYSSRESCRQLLIAAGFSFQHPEGIYRSRPSDAVIADFEADAEKK